MSVCVCMCLCVCVTVSPEQKGVLHAPCVINIQSSINLHGMHLSIYTTCWNDCPKAKRDEHYVCESFGLC